MLVDLPPEVERALQSQAAAHGLSAAQLAAEVLQSAVQSGTALPNGAASPTASEAPARRLTAREVRGSAAHLGISVDDFLRERSAENRREDEKFFGTFEAGANRRHEEAA